MNGILHTTSSANRRRTIRHFFGWIILCLFAAGTAEAATGAEKACDSYTKLAIEQYTQNKKLKCGFQNNRWHANYQKHYGWCLTVHPAAREQETEERRKVLKGCTTATTGNPLEGRVVRVVYEIVYGNSGPRGGTWGFHLAHMKDGRYCVRFGNPGRLDLAIIKKVADICFDTIPGAVDQSDVQTSKAYDTRKKNKKINVSSYHKGSIAAAGNEITLKITTCYRASRQTEYKCSPNRYVVRMTGPECAAEVTLTNSRDRAGRTTCEHYAAK